MPDPKLIEIHDATIWRGSTRVFENLSLDIEQHERVAILGPNGSGKTTLLMTINRELYPAAKPGSFIRILGKDRWNVWELRKQIGVVSNDLRQRRCLLARALVHDPVTLILDEPTSGLDFAASFDYLERIRALARKGGSRPMARKPMS